MSRVFIKTYGCQMNERDTEAVVCKLLESGHEITDEESLADVILLNTCSVREKAEQKAIGKASRILHSSGTKTNLRHNRMHGSKPRGVPI